MKHSAPRGKHLYTSIALACLAILSVTAATVAWLSIADSTRIRSMSLDVTTGMALRFDLAPHNTFDEYVRTLTFEQIADSIKAEKGFDMRTVPLEPVTTVDADVFTFENGTVVEDTSGAYLQFTLNFMATNDMTVHLTSASGESGDLGTSISSTNAMLAKAMRIAFTVDGQTCIYQPAMGDQSTNVNGMKHFGLATSDNMVYSSNNELFFIQANVNKPVLVHVWLEGTDDACTDDLKGADYQISLRFEGTQDNYSVVMTRNN